MIRLKTLAKQLLNPNIVWAVILTLISVIGLFLTFATGRSETVFGIIFYVFSSYVLAVWIIKLPVSTKKALSILQRNELSSRYLTDASYRMKISLLSSLGLNMLYAVTKLAAGIYYASFWYGADAIFYIVLSVARIILMRYMQANEHDIQKEYRIYRLCGVLLFMLNASFIGVVYQIVNQNKGYTYPGFLIYAVAAFSFFSITTAIINAAKYRKVNSPVVTTVKALSLAKALVMMFALQSAMFASFGGENEIFEQVMNIVFGGFVCLSIFTMAVIMVVVANNKLKLLRINNSETIFKQIANNLELC